MATWIVGGVVLLLVGLILWKILRDRKAHKGGCSCGCSHCSKDCRH
ncbi:MAG TPA: FeoB-associated Cys-rich membrane protein [Candidatus Pullichristensenella excrementigallinarum]|uniref:FeoB-associated Cys-rich membrane protein n=1 Tax=Candidatus Pullichristensenella excrementigallinarum TaxID=2840907 RepID=A0A9D1ICW5_9FIRM|nr:FeoB-associated Cys-rich membrane protein [Candidatus Pullichristensenella excrementigallinarum]